tara:strand:+ start:289 stop:663 length:375 start_codon:yes stop_codon:yes gene_type:complete
MTNEQIKQIEDYLLSYCPDSIYRDITDYLTKEQLFEIDLDDLHEYLSDKGFFDIEIIYYQLAMQFLMEHDNSLQDSIDLAVSCGYKAEYLNSELLASLLGSHMLGLITDDAIGAAMALGEYAAE